MDESVKFSNEHPGVPELVDETTEADSSSSGNTQVDETIESPTTKYNNSNTNLEGHNPFIEGENHLHFNTQSGMYEINTKKATMQETQQLLRKIPEAVAEARAEKSKSVQNLKQALENVWSGCVKAYNRYSRPGFWIFRGDAQKEAIARTAHDFATAQAAMDQKVQAPPELSQDSLKDLKNQVDTIDGGFWGRRGFRKGSGDSKLIEGTKTQIEAQINVYNALAEHESVTDEDKKAIADHIKTLTELKTRIENYQQSFKGIEAQVEHQSGQSFGKLEEAVHKIVDSDEEAYLTATERQEALELLSSVKKQLAFYENFEVHPSEAPKRSERQARLTALSKALTDIIPRPNNWQHGELSVAGAKKVMNWNAAVKAENNAQKALPSPIPNEIPDEPLMKDELTKEEEELYLRGDDEAGTLAKEPSNKSKA